MTNNTLAFVAMCNEYCAAVEHASESELPPFATTMLKLLPRIYISAFDLAEDGALDEGYIDQALREEDYESVNTSLQALFGEHDTYLEVFEEDMKYSDTPIAASVAEGLADLFQVFYNFLETMREAPEDIAASAVVAIHEDFTNYWSRTLCNVLRAINAIYMENLTD